VKRGTAVNLLLVLAVVALAALPLVIGGDREFTGSDGQAETAVAEQDPGYRPWLRPLHEPASAEIESGLFALQAALGAGVLGYCLGVARTRRKHDKHER
jgi:cobalt/nickel transport protein